jgi:hypothetical protein
MRCTWIIPLLLLPVAPAPTTQSIDAKCDKLLDTWRGRFDQERMSYVVSPPYVLAGDGGMERLVAYRDHTVLAATHALQSQFFQAKPQQPILILLFESDESYRRLARKWLNDTPDTPYGYFRRDNIMVMNVATGTGTLVHELTHALIKPDFPDVPDWFNEGLGSLYEQCNVNGDEIRGLANWRLPALVRAIREHKLRPLSELIEDPHFYGDEHVGRNYAQARYLLMYLQEHSELRKFYKELKSHHEDDPTGLSTFKALIKPQTLEAFEQDWRQWVLALR